MVEPPAATLSIVGSTLSPASVIVALAVGAVLSSVKDSALDSTLVFPAASAWRTMTDLPPSPLRVKLLPLPLVQLTPLSVLNCQLAPPSRPMTLTTPELVVLSAALLPESLARAKLGEVGSVVSTVMDKGAEGALALPPWSVSVTTKLWLPSARAADKSTFLKPAAISVAVKVATPRLRPPSAMLITSPATAAEPSVRVVLKATRTVVGVVLLVTVAAVADGAAGGVLSKAWLWAVEMSAKLVELPMADEASAIALCTESETTIPSSAFDTVLASARSRTDPVLLADCN